jgi:hypothetical protein
LQVKELGSVFLIFVELDMDWVHELALFFVVLNCLVLIPKAYLTNDKHIDCDWISSD